MVYTDDNYDENEDLKFFKGLMWGIGLGLLCWIAILSTIYMW